MKIKRFVAPGMRQAMKLVRDDQGPDAVILSTRRLEEGIEIIAAIDYDEALVRQAMARAMPQPATTPAEDSTPTPAVAEVASDDTPAIDQPQPPSAVPTRPARTDTQNIEALLAQLTRPAPAPAPAAPSPELGNMRQELGNLRAMLETQLASLAWNDMNRRRPIHTGVLRQLTRMDLDADVAQAIVDALPADVSAEQARYLPLGLIAQRLAAGGRQLAELEGVVAMVGPTGVGKTTTVAKLAAHAVLRHGAAGVALISTDHYRIGAAAQLGQYARLLGVPIHEVHDANELPALLTRLRDRHVILIDSAGMGAHDPQLASQLEILRAAQPRMSATLVLAANAQAQAMDEAVRAYLPLQPRSCILTKLDETPRLGAALSVLIRHRLPLDFTADGQRVPEDIAAADVRQLVCRAARGSGAAGVDDDFALAERFAHPTGAEA